MTHEDIALLAAISFVIGVVVGLFIIVRRDRSRAERKARERMRRRLDEACK